MTIMYWTFASCIPGAAGKWFSTAGHSSHSTSTFHASGDDRAFCRFTRQIPFVTPFSTFHSSTPSQYRSNPPRDETGICTGSAAVAENVGCRVTYVRAAIARAGGEFWFSSVVVGDVDTPPVPAAVAAAMPSRQFWSGGADADPTVTRPPVRRRMLNPFP